MTEIQQNRYDRLVRRVANVVGGGSQVNDTLNELFPIIDVENLPAELYALMGTRLAFGASQGQAGGGLRPQCQLFNPLNSGAMITLTRVLATSTTDPILNWSLGSAAFTTLLFRGALRDSRLLATATNAAVGEIRFQASAVPVANTGTNRILALTQFDLHDENGIAVLSPGFGFNIDSSVVATFLDCTFYWRERTIEPAESNL